MSEEEKLSSHWFSIKLILVWEGMNDKGRRLKGGGNRGEMLGGEVEID